MLSIKNLQISFRDGRGDEVVHGIDLYMSEGETLGLVGESGSGKTVTSHAIAGLLPRRRAKVSGEICFAGRDLLKCTGKELSKIQGRDIGVIFQEPMTSLNPLMKIGPQIEEALLIHSDFSPEQRREKALHLMEKVGLPDPELCYNKYPHQLSGGQRQRAMIAAAIITDPKLLIADEPTTALDVTVQAQIMELLQRINKNRGIAILFISHDLDLVRKLCSRVAVMQGGVIVEEGKTEDIFKNPRHEYTKKLIAAIPTMEKRRR